MNTAEQLNNGYLAFKVGDFNTAINYLSVLDSKCPNFWDGKMYLAMSYWHVGRTSNAIQEFKDISDWCPIANLREKAVLALRELNSQKPKGQNQKH